MRILEAIYSDVIGGSEILGLRLAEEFINRGHACHILATYAGDGKLRQELNESGVRWTATDYTGRSLWKRIITPIRLFMLFRRERYDVIHAHHMSVYFICYWPAKLARIPCIVVTEHAHQHFRGNNKLRRRSRFYGPRATFVTVIHSELELFFKNEIEIPRAKLKLIPNGIDTAAFAPGEPTESIRTQVNKRTWDLVLGTVCRLHVDKDIPNLLFALNAVISRSSANIGLIIVGDGDERTSIEELVRQLGLDENVWLAGAQSDVANWMRVFDIFVLSSRREGVPLVLLEAISCGLPVVATEVGGVADIVKRSYGRLVPREDSEALTSGILELVSGDRFRLMADAARESATSDYSFSLMVDRYLQLFKDRK